MTTTPDQNPENSSADTFSANNLGAENPQSSEAQSDSATSSATAPGAAPSAPLAPPVSPAPSVPVAPPLPAASEPAHATPTASEPPAVPSVPAAPFFLENAAAPAAPAAPAEPSTTRFAPVPSEAQTQPVPPAAPPAHPQVHAAAQPSAAHQPQLGFSDAPGQQAVGSDFSEQTSQPTQPTVEYPAFQQAPNSESPAVAKSSKNSRTGVLLAGLAIGALLGGIVGGGVAAVVSSNSSNLPNSQGSSTLTLSNPESASTISGVAAVATPSVVTLEVTGGSASGSGSGVIYTEDGYIITNAHVVTLDGAAGDSAKVRVKLSDGRILNGDVVGVDPYADLAVVKVEADGLPAIKVADSTKLNVGDTTVAIGAPLNLSNTVTSGVVSAINRGISVGSPLIPQNPSDPQEQQPDGDGDQGGQGGFPWDFRFGTPDNGQSDESEQQSQSTAGTVTLPVIQTDASINPGNSGGALLNGDGELIGINVAIASTSGSSDTAGSVGLGFAIPSNLAVRVADALIDGKQPSHGLLGASVVDSSQDTDADHDFAGGLVVDVSSQGAADKAGLKSGDVITKVDGVPAVDGTSVSALIRMHGGGSKVTIDYMRNGKAAQTEATLGTLEW